MKDSEPFDRVPGCGDTIIYALSHRDFTPPNLPEYRALSVFEDSGDNIADKNCYYSELTGCYWVWKNSAASVVGIAHYRRYLIDEDGFPFREGRIREILKDYDLITTKLLTLEFPYEYGFSKNHKPYYLKELEKLLLEKYPDVYPVYKRLVSSVHTYFGNMLIAKKSLYDEYSDWLFTILFDLESRIVIEEEDSYHRRIFGFISEFLLYVFVELKGLKAYGAMVGMVGEKTEVRSIKQEIARYFKRGDFMGAKSYFLDEYEKRPDILMEASDIGFELHLCMEAISICEYEADAGVPVFLTRINDFGAIMDYLRKLNFHAKKDRFPPEFIKDFNPSKEALWVASMLAKSDSCGIVNS